VGKVAPMTHRCAICSDPHGGCYGYGWPGPYSKLPKAKRGFLWSCADCRPQAEARWAKATQPTIAHTAPKENPQGSLL
jgi:hypothetical protein